MDLEWGNKSSDENFFWNSFSSIQLVRKQFQLSIFVTFSHNREIHLKTWHLLIVQSHVCWMKETLTGGVSALGSSSRNKSFSESYWKFSEVTERDKVGDRASLLVFLKEPSIFNYIQKHIHAVLEIMVVPFLHVIQLSQTKFRLKSRAYFIHANLTKHICSYYMYGYFIWFVHFTYVLFT